MQAMLTYLLDGSGDYEMIISAAQAIGYRLGEYPGDMIGRWQDSDERKDDIA
jgi:hypothetical protein